MIEVHLLDRNTAGSAPMILAVFSFRYDAHLVPSLIANIAPMVDGWVSYDDRAATSPFTDEVGRRRALIEAARAAGASWALAVDPDERIEDRFAQKIRKLTRATIPTAYVFRLRELYQPDSYRVDGIWGRKRVARLISLHDDMDFATNSLHASWHKLHPAYRLKPAGANLYHLKMIAPARRQARRALYEHLDPDRRYQSIGYDYLTDESSLALKRISRRHRFTPPHEEDGKLWMPETGLIDDAGQLRPG